ncbi:hypothetical protein, partial [Streptomyces kasugaensis]|uniref:hypothetical protein n=1 Tax=Streptomyces kasugaensis TaxID=1946 RepID=UPI001A94DD41
AGSRSGPAGLLPRTLGRKNAPPSGGRHPVGGAGLGKGHHKVAPQTGAAPQDGRGKKPSLLDKAARRNRDNDAGVSPRPDRLNARPKKPHKKKNKNKGKPARKKNPTTLTKQQAPDRASTRAAMSWRRRAQYRAGRFLRQHTSAFTRQRIRSATGAARAAGRTVSRYGSPLLAHGLRYGSRALLRAHMALGTIRFSTLGPNWVRPLAKVLHLITTPAARALAWTGTWGWLNRWMYQHTSTQPAGPPRTRRAASTGHRPVTSPGTTGASSSASASSSKGNSSVSYGLEHTLPLRYAAETVRNAGAMMVLNPADNMVGYEATIRALTAVQRAIGDVIRMAAVSSRENFKVNEAIPEAYDDTAVYAYALAGRLESIPTLYRIIHAEQIDNIENPTPQGAKWDQAANQ